MNEVDIKLNLLWNQIQKKNIIKKIRRKVLFPDEPLFYIYHSKLNRIGKKDSDGYNFDHITGTGGSLISAKEALLKCLSETVERYSVCNYKKKDIIEASFQELSGRAIDIDHLFASKNDHSKKIGWSLGQGADGKTILLPSQAIYLNFKITPEERLFSQPITTGAASEFSREAAILKGIYEIVERDAFLTNYLNRLPGILISNDSINYKSIKDYIELALNRNLKIHFINVSNDLQIPVVLCLIIDPTGIGPVISCGLKASLDISKAMEGALCEATVIRLWMRETMLKNWQKKFQNKNISNQVDRALYWTPTKMLRTVNFWTKQKEQSINIKNNTYSLHDELKEVTNKLLTRNFKIYYKDISLNSFSSLGHYTYKVIIPGLQPLYMKEETRVINKNRLRQVARYFGKKKITINPIPHPFL